MLKYFERAKTTIANKITDNAKSILSCLEDRFGILEEDADDVREEHVLSGDEILHEVCHVLDCRNWVLGENIEVTDENVDIFFEKQLNAVKFIYRHYEQIFQKVVDNISLEKVGDQYVDILMFSLNNLNVVGMQPRELWNFIHRRKDIKEWDHVLLLIDLCWCDPFINATLESFFSQTKGVKTDWRNRLGAENLSDLLCVKVEGPVFAEFREKYCDAAFVTVAKLDYNLPSIFNMSSNDSSPSEED